MRELERGEISRARAQDPKPNFFFFSSSSRTSTPPSPPPRAFADIGCEVCLSVALPILDDDAFVEEGSDRSQEE